MKNSSLANKIWSGIALIAFIVSVIVSAYIVLYQDSSNLLIQFTSLGSGNYIFQIVVIAILAFLSISAAPTSTSFIVYALIAVWDWRLIFVGALIGDNLGYLFCFLVSRRFKEKVYKYLPWLESFKKP